MAWLRQSSSWIVVLFLLCVFMPAQISAQTRTDDLLVTTSTTSADLELEVFEPPTPPSSLNITLSPSVILINTSPGESTESTIKIRNNGTEEEYLQLDLATFKADSQGNGAVIEDFSSSDVYQNWLIFSESKFVVKPGEWKTLQAKFSPPPESGLGYYYAILVTRQKQAQAQEGTTVTGSPAWLVLASVNSPSQMPQLQLKSFRLNKRIYEYLPVDFQVEVANTGNIHLAPFGDVFIKQGEQTVGSFAVNKGRGLILPNSDRLYVTSWQDGFPHYEDVSENGQPKLDKQGKIQRQLVWNLDQIKNFRVGRYKAKLLLVYDNGQRDIPLEAEIYFWVFPWRIILLVTVFLLAVISGLTLPLYLLWKKIKNRTTNKLKISTNKNLDNNPVSSDAKFK